MTEEQDPALFTKPNTHQFHVPSLTLLVAAEAKRPDDSLLSFQTINRRPAELPVSC